MSSIKKLAGQTIWYGLPTIAARFLGFILQLFFTGIFNPAEFGVISQIYAAIPFLNIVFTYGLETSYFRFSLTTEKDRLFNTLCISMLISTLVLTLLIMASANPLADFLELSGQPELIMYMAWIVFFDTLNTLPFARLRQEGRPKKYAFVKVLNIVTQIGFTIFFLIICPKFQHNPLFSWYDPNFGVGYILISNMLAAFFTLLFLYREIATFRWHFDKALWKDVMHYSWPLVIVGFGGMINEMLSRLVFTKVSPLPVEEKRAALGIFSANYKLAVLITIFIQAFKMAAEPFFFSQSKNEDARKTYARVMKFFVMACGAVFLVVALFLDVWKILITRKDPSYADGLNIVPILTMGTVFLGIYYNLTIWYKLTNRNMTGAWITLAGAVITIGLNIWWIPYFSYTGSAWATFICYAFMMTVSYILGQKYYPVPYHVPKILLYLGLATVIYLIHHYIRSFHPSIWLVHFAGVAGLGIYMAVILRMEKKEFGKLLRRVKKVDVAGS